ncbi:AaceriAFL193Wp [[Ashbya] aceris (nom. inval.)]|nr:AaceriAFL193Wp [[Ashbya] aceris (nom. inval.)]
MYYTPKGLLSGRAGQAMVRESEGTTGGEGVYAGSPLGNVLDWGIDVYTDRSPTVVNDDFEPLDSTMDELFMFPTCRDSCAGTPMGELVRRVFEQGVPSGEHFLEEFQYTIITSKGLNVNGMTAPVSSVTGMAELHNQSVGSGKTMVRTPTKYGRLVGSRKVLYLQKTISFLPVALFCVRCFRRLILVRSKSRKNIIVALLVAIYLALQQENFHSRYVRYATMLNLGKMLNSWSDVETQMHRYNMRLKELTIYKPITLTGGKPPTYPTNNHALLADLLNMASDMLYYKIKHIATELLSLADTENLVHYCGIYDVNMVTLYGYLHTTSDLGTADKINRLQLLKKFSLCILLSITRFDRIVTTRSAVVLKLFPNYKHKYMKETEKLLLLSKALGDVHDCLNEVSKVLENYKSQLKYIETSINDQHNTALPQPVTIESGLERVTVTLHELNEIQNKLFHAEDDDETLRKFVQEKLHELCHFWEHKTTKKSTSLLPPQVTSPHRHFRNTSNGFVLNVVKAIDTHPALGSQLTSYEPLTPAGSESCLEQDFLESNFSTESGEQIFSTADEETVAPQYLVDRFDKLSHDELRMRLDEQFKRLAIDAKPPKQQSKKERLEVLNMNVRDGSNNGYESGPFYSKEESIPVLYELNQLLSNRR